MPFKAAQVAGGLIRPLFACAAPGDVARLFIVEQGGTIRILDLTAAPPVLKPVPFLTLTGLSTGNEQGLLGLAFHPNFAANGLFFVNYTDSTGTSVVARYNVPAGSPDVANAASATVVLKVPQPFANHNGGWIGFGPDGFLYIALGDGGSGNDPGNRAQNLGELLGKILRIDVDGDGFPGDASRNYKVPSNNPFVNVAGAAPEIWAFGVRNPWRCSFDRVTGELYIADVGQDNWEEVNVQPAGHGGQNYGWRVREGRHDTGLGSTAGSALTDPVFEYDHGQGIAIVGGYVYRGAMVPELMGTYVLADFTGPIWSFVYAGGTAAAANSLTDELFPAGGPGAITSFGEDATGELYIINRAPGAVYRIEPVAAPAPVLAVPQMAGGKSKKQAAPFQSVTWKATKAPKAFKRDAKGPQMAEVADQFMEPTAPGTPVEEARALLQVAASIEHSLLLEYLYALYSLDPYSPGYELEGTFKAIAIEEMGHLISVQNLLLAIGGEPYFARDSPRPANDPFPFSLQGVGLTSLAKYVTAESALEDQIQDATVLARANRAYALAEIASPNGIAQPMAINHVGVLYAKLYWLIQSADAPEGLWKDPPPGPFTSGRHLADADFVTSNRQVTADEISGGSSQPGEQNAYVAPVSNRADALAVLHQIAAQGEGWANDGENSHFERFLVAFEKYAAFLEAGQQPTLPVPTNPTLGDGTSSDRNVISHSSARLWAELSNERYGKLIGELWLAMLLPAGNNLRQKLLGQSVYPEMKSIARIAKKLATLPRSVQYDPAKPTDPARVQSAAAPFQLPPYDQLPASVDGWKQFLRDRISATQALRTRLESAENTIPLLPSDTSQILKPLQTADDDLSALL